MAVAFRNQTVTRKLRLMHAEKMQKKCHKIGTIEVFKDEQATKKVPLLFLELLMHKLTNDW